MPLLSPDSKETMKFGRPPNIEERFPNSGALIIAYKPIGRATPHKTGVICIAPNERNQLVKHGGLKVARPINKAQFLARHKSEGGWSAYCVVNHWNIARSANATSNEFKMCVLGAIQADHYGMINNTGNEFAKIEIPSIFDAGITSIAIDAAHKSDDQDQMERSVIKMIFCRAHVNISELRLGYENFDCVSGTTTTIVFGSGSKRQLFRQRPVRGPLPSQGQRGSSGRKIKEG